MTKKWTEEKNDTALKGIDKDKTQIGESETLYNWFEEERVLLNPCTTQSC